MIPLLSREAVRALDAEAVARLGVPSCILMENAGRGAFDVLVARYARQLARALIVGGVGQNGGDGWVIARHLVLLGHRPRCVLVGDRAKVRGDAAPNLQALEQLIGPVPSVTDPQALGPLDEELRHSELVIDALFGTGLDRPIQGVSAAVIERFNKADGRRVALDIPSGIDADSGKVLGVAVRAELTLTFAAHKRGLHQHPGAAHAGELVLVAIGVPVQSASDPEYAVIEASDVRGLLPLRAADTHKGRGGHVLVVAGAPGRTGAAVLSGHGAMRAGAGLVTLCPRAGARAALDAKVLELMTSDLPAELDAAVAHVVEEMRSKHAAVIGPGLGTDKGGTQLAQRLALELSSPCVLDADALTAFRENARELRKAAGPRVLTPHPAEAARILGCSTEDVQADRYQKALQLAAESGAVVVLKGARTVVATPAGRVRVCALDVPALAVAGTGDVLTGVIAALLTQLEAAEAAVCGVYLHAAAGLEAAVADRGLLAHEVADAVPRVLGALHRR
ncbi:MAG TPA: NAD(P)H-hydrate dehydratase [Polyangiales bacterium]|nr:NAD(P)H-hydrate dehydratase [Polyangiales bacterium]